MTEVMEAKSSPEQKNDQSDESRKVIADRNRANSGQENIELSVYTSSKDGDKSNLTVEVKEEPQNTLTDHNTTYFDYDFSDSDDNDCNTTDNPVESSDSGCSRGNNNPDWEVNDSDIDESNNPTIASDSVYSKNKNDDSEKNISDDDSSSSDGTKFNDGSESNKARDVPAGPSNEKKDQSSSDEENNCITSQSTFKDDGESSKINDVSAGLSNERKDQVKVGTKTKAERKEIYSVPLKKFKKY